MSISNEKLFLYGCSSQMAKISFCGKDDPGSNELLGKPQGKMARTSYAPNSEIPGCDPKKNKKGDKNE